MITIYNCKHLRWSGQSSVSYYEFFADTSSDLPTDAASIESVVGPNHIIAQGSIAWVIDTAKPYMFDSEGNWVLQSN